MMKVFRNAQQLIALFHIVILSSVNVPIFAAFSERISHFRKSNDSSNNRTSTINLADHADITGGVVPSSTFTFSQDLLQLTQKAVYLSLIVYDDDPASSSLYFQYEKIDVFKEATDPAILVKTVDYCIVAYRGTEPSSLRDIYQNIKLGNEPVCSDSGICCNAGRGFYDGYDRKYRRELENKIRLCAQQCKQQPIVTSSNSTETTTVCPKVVLTGHSQGGSIATIASINLSDLLPLVITFGNPPTIDASCPLLDSNRIYRFENSRNENHGPTYDPVPYVPYCASQYGYQIMLGEDPTGVAFIGHSEREVVKFRPWDSNDFFATHRLVTDVGYISRIDALVRANTDEIIIRSTGFQNGSTCSKNVECMSKICSMELCVAE